MKGHLFFFVKSLFVAVTDGRVFVDVFRSCLPACVLAGHGRLKRSRVDKQSGGKSDYLYND